MPGGTALKIVVASVILATSSASGPGVFAMVDPAAQTTQMVDWLDRMRAGDDSARNELIRGFQGRLELLARKMVGRDPRVARWVDAEDVLQNALLRLLRALESVQPDSTRDFFGLAAEQIRRELLDLARHYYG